MNTDSDCTALLPDVEALHDLLLDAQGAPYGARLRYEAIEEAARRATTQDLCDALDAACVKRRLGALLIAARALRSAADPDEAVLEALAAQVGSPDQWTLAWGERPHQRRTLTAPPLAVEALQAGLQRALSLARQAAWRARDHAAEEAAQERALQRLLDALERALDAPQPAEPLLALLRAARALFTEAARERALHLLAQRLADVALDDARFAQVRWAALDALDRAARRPDPDPVTHARERALRGVAAALHDPAADLHLKRRLRTGLAAIAPNLVAELLDQGALDPAPLPDPAELLGRQGVPLQPAIQAAALQITAQTLRDALQPQRPPRDVVAAAALAQTIAQRDDARDLPLLLLAAIPRDDHYTAEHDDRRLHIDVGAFAAERLTALLAPDLRREDPHTLDLYLRALIACAERGLDDALRPASPLPRLLDATRWSLPDARQRALDTLLAFAADPRRAPEARFAALAAERSHDANALAAHLLAQPDEDPALRALIGMHLARWAPDAPHAWVRDPDAPAWTPRPGLEHLPLTEPGPRLPHAWLLAALRDARHPPVRFAAIRHLSARLNRRGLPLDPETLAAVQSDALLPALPALRHLLDDPDTPDAAPRWGACLLLAARGDAHDAPRLAAYIAWRGAWTRLDPFTEEAAEADLLDQLTLHPLALDQPRSLMEPALVAGFGHLLAQRIIAQSLVLLGARALREGHHANARRAFKRALLLDPLNLNARRSVF